MGLVNVHLALLPHVEPVTNRIRGKSSRSRSPARKSFGTGGASSSAGPLANSPEVRAALAKRAGDRTEEETLLAASAAKAAKTADGKENWADVTDAEEMDDAQ